MNFKNICIVVLFIGLAYCCQQNETQDTLKGQPICLCNAGYYGNPSNGVACQPCPSGSLSDPPSVDQNKYNNAIYSCYKCKKNYFMQSPSQGGEKRILVQDSAAVCQICTNGSGNISGAMTQGTAGQCNICQPGYYMTASGSDTAAASCSPCPGNSTNNGATKQGDISQCSFCSDNYYITADASAAAKGSPAQAAQCSVCPPYSSSDGSDQPHFCECYDTSAIPLSASQSTCTCPKGYGGTVATQKNQKSGCTQCDKNQYVDNNTCKTCPSGSVVTKGQDGCSCFDTSDGTLPWDIKTNVCQCKANYYGSPDQAKETTSGSCKPCASGKTSAAGSKTVDQCKDPVAAGNTTHSLMISINILFSIIFMVFY